MHILQRLINEKVNGGTFITIDTLTIEKLPGGKKNPHQGRVTKRVAGSNVMVFQNKTINAYDAMVKRRLEKEGKNPEGFVLGPRPWGNRIPNTPFVEHNGKLYLEVIFLKAGVVTLYIDQVEATPEVLATVDFGDAKIEGDQGGLDNKVIIRTYTVENIKAITLDKQRHEF